ncbi:efflux RND transporter permease subunit [Tepidiphilus sp. J10]|uniref:efflux RND transporter permease subunit n=1 Tax=Tepidiphilus sp. J10 TaxID=2502185 RepID=UPI00115E4031|nr:efflux RND transporter permease subunit [Tepidiphilus sp. J10]
MSVNFFIDRPVFSWVIAIVILLAGALALRSLPVAQYPEVAAPALAISANYPGASAEVIEQTVVALIEQELNGIENLIYMDSQSELGQATINLTFWPGTNLDISSVEAQNRIKRVEARLPDEVRRLGVTVKKMRRNYLMFVSLFSPDNSLDNVDLASFASTTILDPLRRVPGVGDAELFGAEYSMRIWVAPEKLDSYQVTPGDVINAVAAQNVLLAVGEVNAPPAVPGMEFAATVVTRGRLKTPEEFGDIIVRAKPDGSIVRVKDVGRVELGAQGYEVFARLNGQPNAAIGIKLAPGYNALETAQRVRAQLEDLAQYFPPGIDWIVPYDTTPFIEISIREVVKTLFEAVILVFIVMYLFLGNLRATIIPTIVVPVSLLGAAVGLWVLGYSINVLTLFAMVLAIGIVVDDAIVVVENVERVMAEDKLPPREAAHKAMSQIVGAIIGITLVLTSVFIPMAFFPGSVGVIYRQFAITLVLAMGFSALMALTLTPALCASMLKPHKEGHGEKGFFGWFNRGFQATTRGYVTGVRRVITRPWRWMILYALIIACAGWLFARLPGSFLPEEDQGYFITMVQLPSGATQERTQEIVTLAEQYFLSQPEVQNTIGIVGFSFLGRGQNAGLLFVRLKDWSERTAPESSAHALIQKANRHFFPLKEAIIFAINPPAIPEMAAIGGFDFRLQDRAGLGREALNAAKDQALQLAAQEPRLTNVRLEGMPPGPQLMLDIDRDKAETLGVSSAVLNQTLQAMFGVAYINDFERQGRILRVQLQADAPVRMSPENMLQVSVRNRDGNMVKLSEIVKTRWMVGPPRLDRYNGVPALKLTGSPAPGVSSGEAMQAMAAIAAELPTGIGYEWSGTSFEENLSGSQAPMLFAISLIVVFLCLAALYESWSIPFSVMLVVPLGVFGSLLAVTWRGLPNDVYFKVGLVAIIGLSAKNAILIIEFARELHESGKNLMEATLEAARMRFRPILMTSIAFIVGVLPLALSTGAGAQSRHAIGTGVIGGMLAATVLAVFLVPVFFVVVRRIFPPKDEHHAQEPRHA